MKASELMIGDWVMVCPWDETPWKPKKITDINFHSWEGVDFCDDVGVEGWDELSLDQIKPIPLTKEILEKNGFVKDDTWDEWVHFTNGIIIDFTLLVDEDGFRLDIPNARINYVHELQHALKLCGINKEITL